jgi:hypothetical protein
MVVAVEQVKGLRGLVNRVLEISGDLPESHFLWFRGLAHSTHSLIPKIMRDNKTADEVFEREQRLLTRFRQRSLAYWPSGYPQNDWVAGSCAAGGRRLKNTHDSNRKIFA